jgi:hypothetical protein
VRSYVRMWDKMELTRYAIFRRPTLWNFYTGGWKVIQKVDIVGQRKMTYRVKHNLRFMYRTPPNKRLESKSKFRYDRRSVGQSVLVSSPSKRLEREPRPDKQYVGVPPYQYCVYGCGILEYRLVTRWVVVTFRWMTQWSVRWSFTGFSTLIRSRYGCVWVERFYEIQCGEVSIEGVV